MAPFFRNGWLNLPLARRLTWTLPDGHTDIAELPAAQRTSTGLTTRVRRLPRGIRKLAATTMIDVDKSRFESTAPTG